MQLNMDDLKQMVFYDIAFNEEGTKGWFCHIFYNALFQIDMQSHNIIFENYMPDFGSGEINQYGYIAYFENKLVLAPRNSTRILVYDLERRQFEPIKFQLETMKGIFNLFCGIKVYKGKVYLFPGRYPNIVELDLKTYEVQYYSDWFGKLESDILDNGRVIFNSFECSNRDGNCMMPFWQGNKIFSFNLDNKNYRIYELYHSNAKFSCIKYDGKSFWISLRDDAVILNWKIETQEIEEYRDMPDTLEIEGGFAHIILDNQYIYAIPFQGNMIVEIQKESKKARCYKRILMHPESTMEKYIWAKNNFMCYKEISRFKYLFYSTYDGKIYEVDFQTDTWEMYQAIIENEEIEKVSERIGIVEWGCENRQMYRENEVDLIDFLKKIVGKSRLNKAESHKVIGERIYRKLMS